MLTGFNWSLIVWKVWNFWTALTPQGSNQTKDSLLVTFMDILSGIKSYEASSCLFNHRPNRIGELYNYITFLYNISCFTVYFPRFKYSRRMGSVNYGNITRCTVLVLKYAFGIPLSWASKSVTKSREMSVFLWLQQWNEYYSILLYQHLCMTIIIWGI